jgi:lysophospholipase
LHSQTSLISNRQICYRRFAAPNGKAVILAIHGLGAHSDRFNFLATFLQENGFSAYAIELSGFGENQNPPGHIHSFKIYYQNIQTLCQIIKEENPGKKIFILGESMGGLIAFILAAQNPKLFSGMVLMSPAFKSNLKFSWLNYIKIWCALIYNPQKLFSLPFTSAMCTQDTAYVQKMDQDPREVRVASAQLLFNILSCQLRAAPLAAKIQIPTFFLLSGKDYLVDPAASKKIFSQIGAKNKTLAEYPEMLHALYIERDREKVFANILQWVDNMMREPTT